MSSIVKTKISFLWYYGKKKSNVVVRGLYFCRQRYVSSQWSKCCATNWAASQSVPFALAIEYVSSIHPWANSRCWISQSEHVLCFSYVINHFIDFLFYKMTGSWCGKKQQQVGSHMACEPFVNLVEWKIWKRSKRVCWMKITISEKKKNSELMKKGENSH